MRRPHFEGLWRNSDFLKLWAGQTVSVFGSLITGFALPLVAILTLQASPFQVALLGVAELAPGMLFGLFAGAWVDRLRRKPLMILADLGRAALL
nr:MFS transporter [Chloroflexia bacterium]